MALKIVLFALSITSSFVFAQLNETLNFEATANLTTIRISDYLGNRTVAYSVDSDGLAVVEGDVIYGTEAELLSRAIGRGDVGPRSVQKRSHSVFANGSPGPWPANTIRYKWRNQQDKNAFGTAVNAAMQRWKTAHPCLNFVDVGFSHPEPGIIVIQRQTTEPNVCRATVGFRGATSLHVIKLWQTCDTNTIVHELGHSLGLYHEQKRYDREGYAHFNCKAVKDFATYADPVSCCGMGPLANDCCGYACEFTPYPKPRSFSNQGDCNKCGNAYDLQSCMHYRRNAFSIDPNNLNTLSAGPFSNPGFPSAGDICRIKELYPGPCTPPVTECPKFCSPHPGTNTCAHPSAQNCVGFGTKALYCACAPGYKATGYPDNDVAHHWRINLAGHEHRVWVAEGVKCETLCANPLTCSEVSLVEETCWK